MAILTSSFNLSDTNFVHVVLCVGINSRSSRNSNGYSNPSNNIDNNNAIQNASNLSLVTQYRYASSSYI